MDNRYTPPDEPLVLPKSKIKRDPLRVLKRCAVRGIGITILGFVVGAIATSLGTPFSAPGISSVLFSIGLLIALIGLSVTFLTGFCHCAVELGKIQNLRCRARSKLASRIVQQLRGRLKQRETV